MSAASTTVEESFRRGSSLLVFRILQYGFLFLAILFAARILGPTQNAELVVPLTLAKIVWAVFHFSLDLAALRLLARRQLSVMQVLGVLSTAVLVLGGVGALSALGLGLALQDNVLHGATVTAIALAAATVPLSLATHVGSGVLLLTGRFRQVGWISASGGSLLFGYLVVVNEATDLSPELCLFGWVIWNAFTATLTLVALAQVSGIGALIPRIRHAGLARVVLSTAIPLHFASIALFLTFRFDILLVSWILGQKEAGLYGLASSLAEIVWLLPWTVALALLPVQLKADEQSALRYTARFAGANLVFSLLLSGIAAAFAYPFILLIYGREWSGSVVPFIILSFGVTAFAVEAPLRTFLARVARPATIGLPSAFAFAFNLTFNLLLIPRFGVIGAAVVSAVSYWVAALLIVLLTSRVMGRTARSVFSISKPNLASLRALADVGADDGK